MEIEPPEPPPVLLTSRAEANYVRAYGVEVCQDNGLDEVTFTYSAARHWDAKFTVTSEGFMTVEGLDLSGTEEQREVREHA